MSNARIEIPNCDAYICISDYFKEVTIDGYFTLETLQLAYKEIVKQMLLNEIGPQLNDNNTNPS